MRSPALLFAVAVVLAAAEGPPVTKTMPVTETLHGVTITDPYRWLEDQDSPETRAWLDAQNGYTRAYLTGIPWREKLRQRLTEISRVDSVSTPAVRHGRYFFTRRLASENRASICMRTGFTGEDTVIVDPSSVGDEGVSIDLSAVADDGSLIAYGVRRGGEDEEEIRLLDVDKHELLPFRLPRGRYFSFVIKPDRSGVFYGRYVTGQGSRIYYHALGTDGAADGATDGAADRTIFGSQYGADALIQISLAGDGRYLLLNVAFGVPARKTEVYVQDLADNGPIRPIVNDLDFEFRPFIEEGKLFLRTNWKAPNWRILSADLKDTAREKWVTLVPESEWPIDGVSLVGGRILVSYLENVKPRIKQFNADGKYLGDIKLPGIGSVLGFSGRWKDDETFFTYASFVEPPVGYRYQVSTGREEVWFRPNVPVNAENFEMKQVWYESRDKTRVPMFLVHKKGLALDGNRPVFLTGYGGFNVSMTPAFTQAAVIWAELGGVFALPNLRGGAEFGEKWHHGGMFEKKQNVFDDFIGAARWLIANHYTKPERIAIQGTSNGGLLVGAAFTQRPDLFGAVVCSFPLLDMVRYQNFKVGAYWVTEYGSSDDPQQFGYIHKYSPYHNVKKGTPYPAIMFRSGDSDTRVDPLHARKMAALVQASGSKRPVFLDYDTKSGHSAGKPLNAQIDEWTAWMSFLLDQTGVKL
jgi:prolyl oligopeptidase